MSCWVAPSIAAELWGISLDQVMAKARQGEVASCTEHGFFLVGLASDLAAQQDRSNPPTYTPVDSPINAVELEALTEDDKSIDAADNETAGAIPLDEESAELEDWREVRKRMGRMRIPPPRQMPTSQMNSFAA